MFCTGIQLANIYCGSSVDHCTMHHRKELDRRVPTPSRHHSSKSRCDESSHGHSIQDIVSSRSHGSILPDLPQEEVSFPILWKGESSMWAQSSMELVCPRHAFPAPQTSQLTPAPPSPAAARELGDLVPTVTGPQHKKAAQGLGSGICWSGQGPGLTLDRSHRGD